MFFALSGLLNRFIGEASKELLENWFKLPKQHCGNSKLALQAGYPIFEVCRHCCHLHPVLNFVKELNKAEIIQNILVGMFTQILF